MRKLSRNVWVKLNPKIKNNHIKPLICTKHLFFKHNLDKISQAMNILGYMTNFIRQSNSLWLANEKAGDD